MTLSAALVVFGRVLIGGLFVLGGAIHFFKLDPLTQMMAARGVPFPRLALIAGSAFQAMAGAALMAGLFVPTAAVGLIAFTIAASIMFLNFWDMEGTAREGAFNAFMTNVALIGGLLIAAAGAP
jgi:putative oxidoreductase